MPSENVSKNRFIITSVVAAALLAVAGLLLYKFIFTQELPTTSSKFYYYDTQTDELFVDEANLIPPIKAPSGGEGVIAQVYACGDCSGEKYIALLRKYSPEAKQAIEKGLPPNPNGELVRLAEPGSEWVPADSDAGQQIRLTSASAVRSFCKDKPPIICFPE